VKIFSIVLSAIMLSAFGYAKTPSITINAGNPGAKVSKNLYGIFFEEINHAGEGGIYAELIKNRGFEANRMPEDMTRSDNYVYTAQGWKHYYPQPDSLTGWTFFQNNGAYAKVSQTDEKPLNNNNPMSLRFDVFKLGNGKTGVINKGFWEYRL